MPLSHPCDLLYRQANTKGQAGHLFGGSAPGRPPVEAFLGGDRFTARGGGLATDLADGLKYPHQRWALRASPAMSRASKVRRTSTRPSPPAHAWRMWPAPAAWV